MAINPLLPILIGAMQTRNVIKDQNEAEYDEVTGAFIDAAASEFFSDKANQKKRIEKNNNFYKATEGRYGTNVAEFAAKNNLFEGYTSTLDFLRAIEEGQALPIEFRNKLRGTTKDGKIDDTFFKSQGFKTTFAQDQNLAKQQLEDKTVFAAKNLNKGAVSNLADLYLDTKTDKQSPIKSFLFGKKTPDVTKMAAGFEAGLEETEAKSVVPEETTTMADASSLAADTNLIDKKLGFEKTLTIGSTREVDAAIASIFNLTDVQIGPEGIIFPEAYRLRALAIKDVAADLVQSGKYSGDTTTLINDAASFIEQEYFSKLPAAFSNYTVTSKIGESVNATSEFSINKDTNIVTLGKNFNTIFGSFVDNPDTPEVEILKESDLILKQDTATASTKSRSKAVQTAGAKFMMTENAYKAMKNYIEAMPNTALQKSFIQYLPKNLMINVGGNVVPISNRLNGTFGFTTF
tara:strand:+ start:31 stop:1416 length:1386 start_codon:yes stop_codon:yes gene_type:complete